MGAQGFPVPPVLSLCADERVAGTAFYLMRFVPGTLFIDPALPELPPAQRGQTCALLAETLARLHSIDPAAAGLADYGKSAGYAARQIRRWTEQYHGALRYAGLEAMPEMVALSKWLGEEGILSFRTRIGCLCT